MLIPLTIILQSCIGSIAAMLVLMQGISFGSVFQLSLVVFSCGFYNGGVLAQLPTKVNFNLLLLSLFLNLFLIAINGLVLL
jgi:hypothetical protein